ncbi:hypothetical protein N9H77_01335 [Porticoccaceae bacterium]|nr:hypothetical protein [Porticoccaceae bacterium]MDB4559137.1 hypothetical protein [bacterium]
MVTIFGSNTCLHCLLCKQMCEAMDVEYKFLDVQDPDVTRQFVELFPDTESIPQILWKGDHIGGYAELTHKIDEYIINLNNGEVQ